MFLQLGSVPTLVVSSAEIAKEIFKTHDLVFSSRPRLHFVNKLGYKSSSITFAPYGVYWRHIKKIALAELLSARRVQSFEAIRQQEVAVMIETVANSLARLINLSDLMLLLANNVVLRVVIIKEALRLHLPVPLIPRETTETGIIGGYEIPAKTRVFINVFAISMDAEQWEDPAEFKPERFLNSSTDFRGQHFELMIELALANLLLSFDRRVPNEMNAKDIHMEEAVGLTVHKRTPLGLVASPPSL